MILKRYVAKCENKQTVSKCRVAVSVKEHHTMSSNDPKSDLKGLGLSFLIITVMMLGVPLLTLSVYG